MVSSLVRVETTFSGAVCSWVSVLCASVILVVGHSVQVAVDDAGHGGDAFGFEDSTCFDADSVFALPAAGCGKTLRTFNDAEDMRSSTLQKSFDGLGISEFCSLTPIAGTSVDLIEPSKDPLLPLAAEECWLLLEQTAEFGRL